MWLGFENSFSLVGFAVSVVISAKIVYLMAKKRKWKYPIGLATGKEDWLTNKNIPSDKKFIYDES